MIFREWREEAEAVTGFSGHGSRKRIAEALGLTSETIRAGEKSGIATPKMVKQLRNFLDHPVQKPFEEISGRGGRWNASKCIGGAYVTHISRPFAFTALFQNPDPAVGLSADSMQVFVTAYDEMSQSQLSSLVDEAREIAGRLLEL